MKTLFRAIAVSLLIVAVYRGAVAFWAMCERIDNQNAAERAKGDWEVQLLDGHAYFVHRFNHHIQPIHSPECAACKVK